MITSIFELYRPSSGTEGEWFMREWCGHCERDKCQNGSKHPDDCTDDDLCQIIGRTLLLSVDDPDYPTEWIEDDDGPKCTAFVAKGGVIPVNDTQTMDLFEALQ